MPEVMCSTKCAGMSLSRSREANETESLTVTGNSSEFCGSSVAMDVSATAGYQTAEYTGADAGFQGCFNDPATLQQFYFVSSLNSPNLCAENCAMKGYSLSGVTQGSAYLHLIRQTFADNV